MTIKELFSEQTSHQVEPREELIKDGDFGRHWEVYTPLNGTVYFVHGHCFIAGEGRIEQEFPVAQDTRYRLSLLAQMPGNVAGALTVVWQPSGKIETIAIPPSDIWTRYEKEIVSPVGTTSGRVVLSGAHSKYDDVSLRPISKA